MQARHFFPIWKVNDRLFSTPDKAGEHAIRLCRRTDQPIEIYERRVMQEGWKLYCEVIPTRETASLSL